MYGERRIVRNLKTFCSRPALGRLEPASFREAKGPCSLRSHGERRIRTSEGIASRFTVCPVWPLRYLPGKIFYLGKILVWNTN